MAAGPTPLSGLARRLVEDGIIDVSAAQKATESSRSERIPFVSFLVQNNMATARSIAEFASQEFGVPLLDLESFDIETIPAELVDEKLVRQHNALPLLKRGVRLYVAVSDPTNMAALEEIKFQTAVNTEPVLVEEDKLAEIIERYLDSQDNAMDHLTGGDEDVDLDLEVPTDVEEEEEDGPDETPIVRFVHKMLLDAIKKGASDLHFEPYEKSYRVRFRTDGILREVADPPVALGSRLAARLKVMSQLDISERRLPQDGRIKMKISKNRSIDFRVSTLPTLWGEKVVLRILDPSQAKMGIEHLGYEADQRKYYEEALAQPQGMILVTGPTGSGKTVSLYTGLNILNQPERNISTAEDPVEINLEGVNQVNVHARIGLDFNKALRAFLRQDPDIIMVGEIRDLETAEISIKAAQTGHLVLSTLHTNSAAETLTRLSNMGVPTFNIATSVKLIIAQRLARRLCTRCKHEIEVPKDHLLTEGFSEAQVKTGFEIFDANPDGCDKCTSGYKGRVGIYEVVKVTPKMSRIIMDGGNSIQLAEAARSEGFDDLRRSGLKKVISGVTSLAEINRVTME